MSLQIFLHGQLVGVESFLLAGTPDDSTLIARSRAAALSSEVLPRALLEELGLSKMLLGSSGGGQFLILLPGESRAAAEAFLISAAADMAAWTGGRMKLHWAATENLGEWTMVRRRLNEEMDQKLHAPLAGAEPGHFEPRAAGAAPPVDDACSADLAGDLRENQQIGWRTETPARPLSGGGKHTWRIGSDADAIPLALHAAPGDDSNRAATPAELGARAEGRPAWGVLRGDVDNFALRLRRVESVEDHLRLTVTYKHFFAGELEVVCSMPEFWRKVAILDAGLDGFSVYGAWEALIGLAREIERLFRRLGEETVKDYPGSEGKTLTAALEIAPEPGARLADVYQAAGRRLDLAKSAGRDCFHVFGRPLEWKQLHEASELKDLMTRLVADYDCSPQFLGELGGFYREGAGVESRRARARGSRFEKPWRLHRRISRVMEAPRDREFHKLRQNMIGELVGKGTAQWRLRPAGRVALEWASMLTARDS